MRNTYILFSTIYILLLFTNCSTSKDKDTSFKSRMIYNSLKSSSFSEKTFDKMVSKPKRNTNIISEKKFDKKLIVESKEISGHKIITIQSKETSNNHIILLHGGAYVAEATKGHKQLMEILALTYNFRVSFIDYPLAPENNALATIQMVKEAYMEIVHSHVQDSIFLLGDSAGGGLAVSLLQVLKNDDSIRMPSKTALISPWLDLSMSNPDIQNYVETDVVLNIEGLLNCGNLYADQLNLKDPIVSPIYGNLENLSDLKIWVSNYELFYPDCVLFNEKLDSAVGSTSSLQIKEKMMHDWIILPLKESKETISEIAAFFNNTN